MKNYLDEYSMRQASIFELRTLARDMGVNSPTIYKKEQLIDKILKIANGEEKPYVPKSRQGRPPKKKIVSFIENNAKNPFAEVENFSNEKICNMSLNKKDFDNTEFSGSWILACPNTFNYSCDEGVENSKFLFENKTGYLFTMQDGSGFLFQEGRSANADTAIFISNKTIVDYNLKSGDLIECVCKKIISNETRYLTEIKKVNGMDLNKYVEQDRLNFETLKINQQPKGELKLIETNSNLGNVELASRNIYKCKSLKKDMGISCKINGLNNAATLININLEVLPEEEVLLKYGSNNEVFYTIHGDTEKQNNLLVSLAIERIKRLVEQNKHVVVLVNDITKLIKYQNFSLGNQSNDVKYKSLDSVCKLLTLARFIDENKSVTLLCFFKNQVFANNSILIEDEFDNLNCNVIDFD